MKKKIVSGNSRTCRTLLFLLLVLVFALIPACGGGGGGSGGTGNDVIDDGGSADGGTDNDDDGDIIAATPAYEAETWVATGGPSGGLGYDIRMHPDNPDIMYVTDAWAGAFKSTNGGTSWFSINDGIMSFGGTSGDAIPVFSLTIDPNAPDTIWVGTQHAGAVYRSDNAGASWEEMNNGIQERELTIRGFSVEPGNSDVVYLAGEISSFAWNGTPLPGLGLDMTKGVVYKTTDRGENWTRIWYGDNLARYIWINPDNHDELFVSTGIFDREAANSDPVLLQPGGVGILRSRDGGATWDVLGVNNGIREDELYFGSLYMHPVDPAILFAAAGNLPYLQALERSIGAIYRTEDGGDSWERVLALTNAAAVEICETDPNVVYAASLEHFYRSDDGGLTWNDLAAGEIWGPPGIVAGNPIDIQCDPRDSMRVFVNNYGGGNFLSEDGGATWVDASLGYTGALVNQVVVAQDDPRLIYVGTRGGIFSSSDGGETWQGLSYGRARGTEAAGVAVNPRDSSHVIASIGLTGQIPKISYDGGATWSESETMVGETSFYDFEWGLLSRLAFSPVRNGLVIGIPEIDEKCFVSAPCDNEHGVIVSADGGKSWLLADSVQGMATDVAFSPDGGIYVATFAGDMYRSTDSGATWALISTNIASSQSNETGAMMVSLAIDPNDGNRFYAGFIHAGVMLSTDGGRTWASSSSGMNSESSVRDLAADEAHSGVIYAAAENSGVYVSTDSGVTWRVMNNGLLTRAAVSLALAADGSALYVGTRGGGVFRLGATAP